MSVLRHSVRVLVSLLLAVTAAGHAAGLEICVGLDGHGAVEFVPPAGCCVDEHGSDAPEGAALSEATACGPCVDYDASTPGVLTRCPRTPSPGVTAAVAVPCLCGDDTPSIEPTGNGLPPGTGPLLSLRAVRVLR